MFPLAQLVQRLREYAAQPARGNINLIASKKKPSQQPC